MTMSNNKKFRSLWESFEHIALRWFIRIPAAFFAIGQSAFGQTIFIDHVSVVDIVGNRILSDHSIQVAGERIVSIAPTTKRAQADTDKVVDATGLFAYPSLFDSHIHLNEPERESLAMVANGVLYARDMGGQTAKRIALKGRAKRGELNGLQLSVTGTILDGKPPFHSRSTGCDTPEEGRQAVRNLKKSGVDQIKVYSLLKPDVYGAIAEEAKSLGLPVVGHIPDSIGVKEAIAAGQRSVEHMSRMETLFADFIPPSVRRSVKESAFASGLREYYPSVSADDKQRLFAELKQAGMAQCPTLVLLLGQTRTVPDEWTRAAWQEYSAASGKPWWESEIPSQWLGYGDSLRSSLPAIYDSLREMHEAGVPLLIGTDLANLGILPGFSVHQEMRVWQSAGIPSADILRYATIEPAKFMKCEQDFGSIEAGKGANFVLARRNPMEDIQNAAEIQAVVVGGKYLDRDALDAMLTKVKQLALSKEALDVSKIELQLNTALASESKLSYSYQQWPSGGEKFGKLATKGRLEFESLVDFGGWGVPLLISGRGNAAGQIQEVKLESITKLPSVMHLVLNDGKVKTRVSLGDSIVSEKERLAGKDLFLFSWALVDGQLNQFQLKPGDSTTIALQTWNTADQELEATECKLSRRDDEELEWNAVKQNCQVYVWIAQPPADRIAHKVWISTSGKLLKAIRQEGAETRSVLAIP